MNSKADQVPVAPKEHSDEEYDMPCAEAVLAGTLALMTGHVQACCVGSRALMARNVVSNLAILSQHPQLSLAFRAMLFKLRGRWIAQDELQSGNDRTGAAEVVSDTLNLDQMRVLWHKTPEIAQ